MNDRTAQTSGVCQDGFGKNRGAKLTSAQAVARRGSGLGLFLATALLAACGEKDVILPGERVSIRGEQAAEAFANEARPIALAAPVVNAEWTHRNGGPSHTITHPVLEAELTQIFAVNIGAGNSRRLRITADPVVAGGQVFTLDAQSTLAATSTGGEPLWSRSLIPPTENARDASGGGLAAAQGVVIATTGFGEVVALDPATGNEIWRQDLDAPGTSAPTIFDDLAYIVGRDGRAWALELGSGRIRWTQSSPASEANFAGGAGAAVSSDFAIFPFSTGEILASFPEGGLRRWSTVVTGQRDGQAASTISDIAADPVIDGRRVYVGNVSGRVVALEIANGDRIWTATEGAVGPVWPAGDSVFLVNDLNELVRLDAADGTPIWHVTLPGFVENRERRQKTRFAHYGPILAGNRLIVASSDGVLRQFDPSSGALIGAVDIPGGAASNPVVANGVLYVVTGRGQLMAFR